ncbi:ethylmalonyl-CoA decarboxylase-like [Littorina saxatilis]|uniref:ethylmalonyl-CoA decarboxylase-like n=1 Tax=Littorina saxatilis TaxID=31220 RepID=UPI0038B63FE5
MRPLLHCGCICQHSYGGLRTVESVRQLSSQLAEIREQLGQYRAGSVDLTKNNDTGVAIITLNNPQRKNALSGSMMVELADHVTDLSQWQAGKGLLLRGAEGTFCSGGDLTTVSAILTSSDGDRMSRFMHDTLSRFHALPLMSVALLEGVALGGGAELATACDLRVMTDSARVGFVQVKMGVTTGWGGATRLYRLLGRHKTLALLCSGKLMTADQALALGFAQDVIPDQPLTGDAVEALLLDRYVRGPVPLVRAVKEMVVGIENSASLKDALDLERNVFASVWGGEAQKAALQNNIKHS